MFSLEVINYLNQQAARKARRHRQKPFVPSGPGAVDAMPPFPFPSLGDFDPPEWERTDDSWFCDKTGWGRADEPALTIVQLKHQLRCYIAENPGHGFAITEEGQFQLYVTAFLPV
jgi:hypothetical protein